MNMRPLVAVPLLLLFAASPALAQRRKSTSETTSPDAANVPRSYADLPTLPTKGLEKSGLPPWAQCTFKCTGPMQACQKECKGEERCMAKCSADFGACSKRCGGPPASEYAQNRGGAGAVGPGERCAVKCIDDSRECKSGCGKKQPCLATCNGKMEGCLNGCGI